MFGILKEVASRTSTKGNEENVERIGETLDILEKKIDRCKVMYEQYFMGIQKQAPGILHKEIERTLRDLKTGKVRNTAIRFKLNSLSQKFASYNTYWRRVLRQIEKGIYVRDIRKLTKKIADGTSDVPDSVLAQMPRSVRDQILRARTRGLGKKKIERNNSRETQEFAAPIISEKPTGELPRPTAFDLGSGDAPDYDALLGAMENKPATPPVKRRRPPPPPRVPQNQQPQGMTAQETRALYNKYMQARRIVGNEKQLSYDQLVNNLKKKTPQILNQHQAKRVEFKVVVKDNKAILKAVPKK